MKGKIINTDALEKKALEISLSDAIREIWRENNLRAELYERWARSKPTQIDQFKRQYTASFAIEAALRVMQPREWQNLMNRAKRQREEAVFQKTLFDPG